MKNPMVLKGSGEAPKAVPSRDAMSTFQPRLNSFRLVAGATLVFMGPKHNRSTLFGAGSWE
jgi:hypothetical protein